MRQGSDTRWFGARIGRFGHAAGAFRDPGGRHDRRLDLIRPLEELPRGPRMFIYVRGAGGGGEELPLVHELPPGYPRASVMYSMTERPAAFLRAECKEREREHRCNE